MQRFYYILFLLIAPSLNGSECSVEQYDKEIYQWTTQLTELLNAIRNDYYIIPCQDIKKALLEGTKKIARCLDPHSDFYSQEEFKSMQESIQGEFCGIGIVIDGKEQEAESLTIIDVVVDGPAEKSGLRAADKIVQIDQEGLRGKTLEHTLKLLKGKKGQQVHVKIQRSSSAELLDIIVTREIIKDNNETAFYFKEQNVFYLALNMFTDNSTLHMKKLVEECQKKNAQALILDLRNNSGGLLHAVVDIAGLFLAKGSVVVSSQNREGKSVNVYKTLHEPIIKKSLPIFIIVNNFTASAAEILTGALTVHAQQQSKGNEHLQVFSVGCTTFGKGSVQQIIPANNDCAIKLTIALYYLPDGSSIQSTGITPDFIIPHYVPASKDVQWFNKCFGQESSFHNAINKHSSEQYKQPTTLAERRKEHIKADHTVISTLRISSIFDMTKKYSLSMLKDRTQCINFLHKKFILGQNMDMEEIKI